jgi:FkbM family methyltransferase
LVHNISLNNATQNITPEKLALSNHKGETVFYQHFNSKVDNINEQLGGGSSLAVEDSSKHEFVQIKVSATTIDDFVIENNIKQIDFIKLDTETTEHLVLKGAVNSLQKFKPLIICEVFKNKIENELEILFDGLGYKYFRVTHQGLHQMNKLCFDTYKEDIYFVHPSKDHLIKEFIYKDA